MEFEGESLEIYHKFLKVISFWFNNHRTIAIVKYPKSFEVQYQLVIDLRSFLFDIQIFKGDSIHGTLVAFVEKTLIKVIFERAYVFHNYQSNELSIVLVLLVTSRTKQSICLIYIYIYTYIYILYIYIKIISRKLSYLYILMLTKF